MALINCKNCGELVSEKAKICPHCGTVLLEDYLKTTILCEECGTEIPEGADTCPKCGFPIKTKTETSEHIPSTPVSTGRPVNNSSIKVVIWIVLALGLLFGIYFISQNTLTGDDKIAYDLVLNASKDFKNPSSVRLVSGEVYNDCLMCGISATNGWGARTTSYYYISNEGWILEQENPSSIYKSLEDLNIKKINKKLEKTLGPY